MLGRYHAAQVTVAEPAGPPIVRLRNEGFVPKLRRIDARHAQQVLGILPGHGQPALAARRGDKSHLGIEHQRLGLDGPGVALVVRCQLQNARLLERQQSLAVQVGGQALGQQGLLAQHGCCPAVIPSGALAARQFVKARLGAHGQQHRAGGVIAHFGHPLGAAAGFCQGIDVGIACVVAQLGVHHPAAPAHMGQGAPQPLGQGLQFKPVGAKLFAVARQQVGSHRLHHTPRHRQRGLARALQGAPPVAQVSHLAVGLPEQPLFHLQRQATLNGQVLLFLQLHRPIALPHHVRRHEL